jgi:uncharacterized membrane protein
MKSRIIKLMFVCFCAIPYNINAQLYFKNNTSEPVEVAYAKWNDDKHKDHWFTKGWWKVDPGETKRIASGIGLQDYCYYYAQSVGGKKKYDGKSTLLIHPTDAFDLDNADKQYQKNNNPDYQWVGFRKHTYSRNLLGTHVKQTIILNY